VLQNDINLTAMAEALSRSADYRVLRRLVPRTTLTSSIGQDTKIGILIDIETTGLDARKDEVIELGMLKFDYLASGHVVGVRDVFSSFAEPTVSIPLEVIALTGITDEMVAGQRIDEAAVSAFVDDAVIVIAHNAGFDRKFAERHWPIFERKAWGCSATEVEWRKHGFEGSRLGYLLNGAGFFHQAHRAVDDCHALLEILALELPTAGTPALAVLLAQARRKTMRMATAGVMGATAGPDPGTSMSWKARWRTRSRFSDRRSTSVTWSRDCRTLTAFTRFSIRA
jgi:DNA polymerase III subunit epsilon